MKNRAMATVFLLGALAAGFALPCSAQNALGGATKTKQSTVGGAAKPGPVLGGATTHAPMITKPGPVGGVTKQGSVGGTPTPGSTGSATRSSTAGGTATQNPPVTPPNKGGTVVTTSNLKCGAGACVTKGAKP